MSFSLSPSPSGRVDPQDPRNQFSCPGIRSQATPKLLGWISLGFCNHSSSRTQQTLFVNYSRLTRNFSLAFNQIKLKTSISQFRLDFFFSGIVVVSFSSSPREGNIDTNLCGGQKRVVQEFAGVKNWFPAGFQTPVGLSGPQSHPGEGWSQRPEARAV